MPKRFAIFSEQYSFGCYYRKDQGQPNLFGNFTTNTSGETSFRRWSAAKTSSTLKKLQGQKKSAKKLKALRRAITRCRKFEAQLIGPPETIHPCANYSFFWQLGPIHLTETLQLEPSRIQKGRVGIVGAIGYYPQIHNGVWYNAGLPQLVDMESHLAKVKSDIVQIFPDPNFDGLVVIDWEGWLPISRQNTYWGNWVYKYWSEYYVQLEHPGWSPAQIEAEAKYRFEHAALELMVKTIQAAKSVRHSAKFTYYSFPTGSIWQGYQTSMGDLWRAENDQIAELWQTIDAIAPSIYITYPSGPEVTPAFTAEYIDQMVGEAVRLKQIYGKPVYPYTWHRIHNSNALYGLDLLSAEDLRMSYDRPRAKGADGVIIWGWEADNLGNFQEFTSYLESTLKPTVTNICGD